MNEPPPPPAAPSPRARGGDRLELAFQSTLKPAPVDRAFVRRVLTAALPPAAVVTVRLVGAAEGRRLNRDYRGRDRPTNVLSFPYDPGPPLAGDLVLCAPVIAREAEDQGKPLGDHYAHLLVHGALHLRGFDHAGDAEAARMEALESGILHALGVPDPYRPAAGGPIDEATP